MAAAYGLSLYLTIPANPEVKFWSETIVRRDTEIAKARLSSPNTPIIFFTGGSSTAFSIDPKIIEQSCNLPTFNLGLPIAAGASYILHQALQHTQSGDILIVCLEADILAYGGELSTTSLSFSLNLLDQTPGGAGNSISFNNNLTPRELLNLPRPGARYLATLAARVCLGKEYRYKNSDIRYHGRIETSVNNSAMIPLKEPNQRKLHPSGAALLSKLSSAAKQRGLTVFYSMPWHWTQEIHADGWRKANSALLSEINIIIPVLDDGTRGVSTLREHFSDSVQHLTAAGSKERTQTLAPILKAALALTEN